jgi:hypothetical protein
MRAHSPTLLRASLPAPRAATPAQSAAARRCNQCQRQHQTKNNTNQTLVLCADREAADLQQARSRGDVVKVRAICARVQLRHDLQRRRRPHPQHPIFQHFQTPPHGSHRCLSKRKPNLRSRKINSNTRKQARGKKKKKKKKKKQKKTKKTKKNKTKPNYNEKQSMLLIGAGSRRAAERSSSSQQHGKRSWRRRRDRGDHPVQHSRVLLPVPSAQQTRTKPLHPTKGKSKKSAL